MRNEIHAPWRNGLLLAGLFALGLFVRWIGVNWCFPLLGHSDEPIIVANAVHMLSAGNWDPGTYGHPDHLSIYLHALAYKVATPGGVTVGDAFRADPLRFYRLSRLLNGCLSAGLILVAFGLGRTLSLRHAWLAAGLVTFFPSFIEHGYYATSDIPLTLFLAVSLYGCVLFRRHGDAKALYLAAAGGAMALAVKYPGAISVVMISAAVAIQSGLPPRRKLQLLVRAAAVFLITAFAVAPYLFLHFDQVLISVGHESEVRQVGASGLPAWGNAVFYIQEFARRVGLIVAGLTLLGYGVVLRRRHELVALAGFGLLFLGFISLLGRFWERWGLPFFFCSLVAAAVGALWLWDRTRSRPLWRGLVAAAGLLGGANMIVQSVYLARVFCLPDTRVVSGKYCELSGITPERTLYETYTGFAPRLIGHFQRLRPGDLTAASLKRHHVDYVITSSLVSDRFTKGYTADHLAVAPYRTVAQFKLVKRFPSMSVNRTFWYDCSYFEISNLMRLTRALLRIGGDSMSGPDIAIYHAPVPRK